MKIIRKRLYEGEGLPTNVRYSEDCDCVEITFDGGETWVEREEFDPRHGSGYRAPPLDTSDPRCDAAAGMVFAIEDSVNVALGAASIIDAANAFFALITVFNPGFGILMKILILLAEFMFAIGTAALTLAFDNDAYDLLTCIFYDEIGEDGQMSQAQLEAINTRVCAEMDVTVCAVVGFLLNTYGSVTFSNAGALAGQTGDCSDCDDLWCYDEDFLVDEWSWVDTVSGGSHLAQWVLGVGFVPQTSNYIVVQSNFTGHVTSLRAWYTQPRGRIRLNAPGTPDSSSSEYTSGLINDPDYTLDGGLYRYDFTLDHDVTGFELFSDPETADGALVRMERKGTGTNPFGSDNC